MLSGSPLTSHCASRHEAPKPASRPQRGPVRLPTYVAAAQSGSVSPPARQANAIQSSYVPPPQPTPPPVIRELGPVSVQKLSDWSSCYASQYYEHDHYLDGELIEGSLPPEMRGTYLLNSPALSEVFGHRCRNLSDADGMVTSLAIGEDGRVFFRNRFVRTPSFASEQLAGRRLHRGAHDAGLLSGGGAPLTAWLLNPLDMRFPSRANAGVLQWGGRVYALSEHALPFELNKQVLDTIGESSLGGVLQPNAKQLAGRYKVIQGADGSQRLVLMSVTQSLMDVMSLCAVVAFTELDEAGRKVAETQHRVLGALAITITDFSVTENWYVVVAPPVSFNPQRFATAYMVGDAAFAECLDFDSGRPSKVHLVPRGQAAAPQPAGRQEEKKKPGAAAPQPLPPLSTSAALTKPVVRAPIVLDGPALVTASTINSYECSDGRLVVLDAVVERDLGHWKDITQLSPGYYQGQPKPEIARLVIDTQQPSLRSTRVLSHRSVEHAVVAPGCVSRPHRFVLSAASAMESAALGGPPQAISKLMVPPPEAEASAEGSGGSACCANEVWYAGDRCFVGPLLLLPKAGAGSAGAEDDAWVVCTVHDAETRKAQVVVLDASRLTSGPVARIRLPHHVPYARGAAWTEEYCGPGMRMLRAEAGKA